ncbi:MAG TPA: exodeoxyribonuclease VII large subunit [Tepidisphaeraceae bacterium]|nr:exodeoxyribonuclease VII large subunit [Tepidisphaeraceae bacterium]
MSGTNFFEFREKLIARRGKSSGLPVPAPMETAHGSPRPTPLSVTQLTAQIDRAIKSGVPGSVLVKGEVSNFKEHRGSGHLYFTLKDAASCITCVMWKSDAERMKFAARDGMELLATGRVAVYATQGKYQLYVTRLQPFGQGALELAFRQLHARLEAEGLFALERKKPLPTYPSRLALATSRATAALQDMLKVLGRYPWVRLCIVNVPVQGDGAAERIAGALTRLSRPGARCGNVDLILLARGGGSLEDLWAFNEEIVARAIAASRIPVITGIGHEVDTSIADLVADYHAHTPTEAAQVAVMHWRNAGGDVAAHAARLHRSMRNLTADARRRLESIERHEAFRRPRDRVNQLRQLLDERQRSLQLEAGALLQRLWQRIAAAEQGLSSAGNERLRRHRERLAGLNAALSERHPRHVVGLAAARVAALDARLRAVMSNCLQRHTLNVDLLARHLSAVGPEHVLRRGYSITTVKKGPKKAGQVVRSADQVRPGDRLITRLADGQIESTAEDPNQPSLFP